ncbi:MAG: hypothetical protein JNJ75_10485 [Cyclobacteriaceae bacterium]|nr:hypothetical protein [Cyclobacteriaceae bacterium]
MSSSTDLLDQVPVWKQVLSHFNIESSTDSPADRTRSKKRRLNLDHANVSFLEKVQSLYALRGGWEIWLQCELSLWMSANLGPDYAVEREVKVWKPTALVKSRDPLKSACDIVLKFPEGSKYSGLLVELKCEKKRDNDGGDALPAMRSDGELAGKKFDRYFADDVNKFLELRNELNDMYKSYIPLVIGIVVDQNGIDAMRTSKDSFPGIRELPPKNSRDLFSLWYYVPYSPDPSLPF